MKSLQNFFLILKKLELHKAQFKILQKIKNNFTCHKRINHELFEFYKGFFSENLNVSKNEIIQFLILGSIPQLPKDQSKDCEFILSQRDLLLVLNRMPNNKSPCNDGLTKEFYEVFCEDLKTPLISSFKSAFDKGDISSLQKPAVIKLIEKKEKDKRLIQNWRPIQPNNLCRRKIYQQRRKTFFGYLTSNRFLEFERFSSNSRYSEGI